MRLSLELLGYSLSRKTGVRIHARVKPTPGRRPRRGSFASGEGFGRPVLATESSIGTGCAAASDVYSWSGRAVVLDSAALENMLSTNALAADALYLCAGTAPEAWFEMAPTSMPSLVEVPSENVSGLLNLVQGVFDLFDGWESSLKGILLDGGGFQAMLEATDSVMFHPLALQDSDFHLVAFSNMAREQGILEYFVDGRSLAPEVVGNMVEGGAYARIVDNRGPYTFDLREVRGVALNLRYQERFEGFLLVNVPEMDESLAAYYGDVLTVLGDYAGRLLGDRGRFESHWLTSNELRVMFLAGLRGEPLDPTSWSKALIDSGWRVDEAIRILCMRASDAAEGTIGYLKKAVDQRWPAAVAVLQGDELAVLASEGEISRHLVSPQESELGRVLQDLSIKVGASRRIWDCGDLRTAFAEAEQAAGLAPVWEGGVSLIRFENVALEVLVGKALETLPVKSLCDEALVQLAGIDEESHTDYLDTVRAYLDNRLNAAAAARALSIQRSTFFYRLGRIKELTGLDIEKADSEQLAHIALSVWMLRRKGMGF